jgi:predicted CoA-binding protein
VNVAVLGASDNPERYSYQAVQLLREKGHRVFPVNPKLKEIEGVRVYPSLKELPEPVHTLSVYLSKEHSSKLAPEILGISPQRILFNPGAENPELEAQLSSKGIRTLEACTLVLLRTNQFDR